MSTIESNRPFWKQSGFPRPALGVPALTLLVSIFIFAADNIAFWREIASVTRIGEPNGWIFAAATAIFLVSALALMMSVFAFKWVYKPFLIALLLIAAVVSYFMQTYGVVIDDTMILNTLETDPGEVQGLLNIALLWHLILFWVLPSLFVIWVRIKRSVWWKQALVRVVFAAAMFVVAFGALASHYKEFSLTMRSHRILRMYINPTYAIYSAAEVFLNKTAHVNHSLIKIGLDAHRTPGAGQRDRRKVMILVIGETTRAANWGLNGYKRNTTPELAALDRLLNFPKAYSCGTSTAISVPCMFSYSTRENFDVNRAGYTENLLDVLERTGIEVRWLENQAGGCKGVCARVPTFEMDDVKAPRVCSEDGCRDAVFLHNLGKRIESSQGDLLIVMHTMGSHGPKYFERYPPEFRVYTPTCDTNRPQQCSRQSLINTYDNTIRYIDHVLASIIEVLKKHTENAVTALLYASDHGESLGEHGIYLHGFPYIFAPEEQKHIPMVVWMSKGFMQTAGITMACAERQTHQRVGHDNLFATVMAMMDVTAGLYRPRLDIFAPCRKPGKSKT